MNLKALITTALLIAGTSSAALAAPAVVVERGHGPVVHAPIVVREPVRAPIINRGTVVVREPVRAPIVERGPVVVRPAPIGPIVRGPVIVRRPIEVRRVWHPIIRPLVQPVIVGSYVGAPCGDGLTTIGSFDVAFDGAQSLDLGAGRAIDTLRVASDPSTVIYSVTVTYADGETQTIPCDRYGSFETDLGGNLVTNLTITADHPTNAPLQVQA